MNEEAREIGKGERGKPENGEFKERIGISEKEEQELDPGMVQRM